MANLGWSYPAGCNGTPDDDGPEPSVLSEAVLILLENAGCPTDVNDQIMQLIENWEISKQQPEEQPPLNIKIGNHDFVAIKYWWEDSDFIFVTNSNEEYRCNNAYPTSFEMDSLDYTFTEETTVEMIKR